MGWADQSITAPLGNALNCVELPQIKTLILPHPAYPLLQHCPNVEDVTYVVRYETALTDEFLKCFTSKQRPNVRRLAIPLTLWPNPSRKQFKTVVSWGQNDD